MMRTKLVVALTLLACDRASGPGGATWQTGFDSTGDTIVARVTGGGSETSERRLVLGQRIGEAEGSDTVTFGQIGYIGVTADSRIFVLDHQGPTIKLLDSTGAFVRFVGRKGAGPGEFEQVTGMDVLPNGHLVLWDASHSRINVYDSAGAFVAQWPLPISGFFTLNGLSTDREGATVLTVPVTSSGVFGQSGFIRLDSSGVVRDTIRVPRWIDSTPQLIAATPNQQARASLPLPFARKLTWIWSQAGALVSGPGDPYVLHITRSGDHLGDAPDRARLDVERTSHSRPQTCIQGSAQRLRRSHLGTAAFSRRRAAATGARRARAGRGPAAVHPVCRA